MTSFIRELFFYARTRKSLVLVPILVVMVLVGALLLLSQTSALAPFIYTIF